MNSPLQIVLILDVEDKLPDNEVIPLLSPDRSNYLPFRLSDFGMPVVTRHGPAKSPVDWDGLARAVVRMVSQVKTQAQAADWPIEYYIVGRAPLPVFIHVGMELSAWNGPQTFLNRRKDGKWDKLALSASQGHDQPSSNFFDRSRGLDQDQPAEGTGEVAIFISTVGSTVPIDAIREFIKVRGHELTGLIEIQTQGEKLIDEASVLLASNELAAKFSQVRGCYPHSTSFSVFVAGSASLAYLVGRSINPHIIPTVVVSNFDSPSYEMAVTLPWQGRGGIRIGEELSDKQDRKRVLNELCAGILVVQKHLKDEDLPRWIPNSVRADFLAELNQITVSREPVGADFRLDVLSKNLGFGDGLLEALREVDAQILRLIGPLLLLHEQYHFGQKINLTNYREIGRAGVVLEELDFWADALAIECTTSLAFRMTSTPINELAIANIDAALTCMQAFDQYEHGTPLQRLYERRLRRYLIWHLQKARANYLTTRDTLSDLLRDRMVLELAPLEGHLDIRFDKIVKKPLPSTELFIVINKRLLRHSSGVNLDITGLVKSVRYFDWANLQTAMKYLVNENPKILVSWVKTSPDG